MANAERDKFTNFFQKSLPECISLHSQKYDFSPKTRAFKLKTLQYTFPKWKKQNKNFFCTDVFVFHGDVYSFPNGRVSEKPPTATIQHLIFTILLQSVRKVITSFHCTVSKNEVIKSQQKLRQSDVNYYKKAKPNRSC